MITIDEIRTVLAAFYKDKKIRFRPRGTSESWVITGNPSWDFLSTEYSPVQQPREWVLNLCCFDRGLTLVGYAYETQTDADVQSTSDRVACVRVREILEGD